MVTITNKEQLIRVRQNKLKGVISDAIDNFCREENHQITYTEITSALIDTLKSYQSYELINLINDEENGDDDE